MLIFQASPEQSVRSPRRVPRGGTRAGARSPLSGPPPARGLEPPRAGSNGCRVHLLGRSGTLFGHAVTVPSAGQHTFARPGPWPAHRQAGRAAPPVTGPRPGGQGGAGDVQQWGPSGVAQWPVCWDLQPKAPRVETAMARPSPDRGPCLPGWSTSQPPVPAVPVTSSGGVLKGRPKHGPTMGIRVQSPNPSPQPQTPPPHPQTPNPTTQPPTPDLHQTTP